MKVKYTLLILTSFIFCCTTNSYAQNQKKITGTVTDAQTGDPLVGVNILVVGTSTGAATDAKGHYSVSVPSLQDTLRFSFIGYQTKTVPINGQTTISIKLKLSVTSGKQLVVVGYGEKTKNTLTGSVSEVSAKSLEKTPVTNMANALSGKAPGIITINSSGEPGSNGTKILVRGNHSLNYNGPLIVIDGVPSHTDAFNRLSPSDIKNLTVLKGPTAAIYGAEAANGVILVTTKNGSFNQTPEFTVNFRRGFNRPAVIPKMASAPTFMRMLNELNEYNGVGKPYYTKKEIAQYSNPNRDPWLYPETDWFKAAYKNLSPQMKGDVSVEGGTSNITYFLSAGGRSKDGYMKHSGTKYNQLNLRSNIGVQASKNIKLTLNLSGRWENRNYPNVTSSDTYWMLMRGLPNMPAYYPNGLPATGQENGWNPVVSSTTQTGYHHDKSYFFNGVGGIDITIPGVKGLELVGKLSYNKEFVHKKIWGHSWVLYSFSKSQYANNGGDPSQYLAGVTKGPADPRLTMDFAAQHTLLASLRAKYKRTFGNNGNNTVNFMVGTEQQRYKSTNFNAFRRHYLSTAIPQLFAGSEQDLNNGGSAARGARLSLFGRADYNYKSKYLFNFVGRYDGSYLFPKGERFGFFPAISVGWVISKEPFFENNVKVFNNLKFRASWGILGNDRVSNAFIGNRQYLASYQFGGGYVFGPAGQNVVKSIYQAVVPNPDITWEDSRMIDVGLNASMFSSHFGLTFDYFTEMRNNILIHRNASIPKTTGLSLPRENLGKVKSWGYDGSISWNDQGHDFSYTVKLNGGYSTDKIVFWDEPPGAPSYQKSTGLKINTSLYYKTLGVFQNEEQVQNTPHWPGARPGDLIFADINHDGKINGEDRIRINKNNTPTMTGGLSLSGRYKQFDVSVLFQAAAGAAFYVATTSGFIGNYFKQYADKRWRPDPNAKNDPEGMVPDPSGLPYSGPRAYNRDAAYWSPLSSNHSTYFLRSTNYIRLKSAEIGYTLPVNITTKAGIKNLRIYMSGFNLLTWSKLKVMDPEASNSSGRYYPQSKVFNFGISLKF
jgi:TonB-linked SusC/RagA family outer membrane protein